MTDDTRATGAATGPAGAPAQAALGFGVGVAQFTPSADKAANLAAIAALARTAAARGARLVVFPEYASYFVDPIGPALVENAEPLEGPFVSALSALAQELDVHIIAGLVARAEDPAKFANLLVAVSPVDGVVASYSKQHLYDAFGARESDYVEAGALDAPQTFSIEGVTIGMQTCYDIRFPEVTRRLVDAGADLVAVPAEWVRGPLKEHHWRSLVTARALENTVYVAAADQTPPIGVGCSLVVDPMGVTIASLGERPDVAVAWIDPRRIDDVRRVNPALALRRFGVHSL
jgi:predicted amidohydrolase